MSSQPLVSIILPTYNRAHLVGSTIESIIRQSYSNWELLVVDDGSADNTSSKISEWSRKDNRVKYFKLEKNSGASAARNYGISQSAGEFITFIDSDDQYDTEKIRLQVEKFQNSEKAVGAITCGRRDFNSKGEMYKEWVPNKRGDVRTSMFRDERIGAGTPFLMVKREAVGSKVRFDTNINVVEDFDFLMQILQHGYTLDFVAAPLVNVYHIGNIERNFSYERGFAAREYLYKKYQSFIDADKQTCGRFLFKTVVFYCMFSDKHPQSATLSTFKASYPLIAQALMTSKLISNRKLKNGIILLVSSFFNRQLDLAS